MAKDNVFMGVAAVGGVGLGYALTKLMGAKASASLEAVVANLAISRDPPNNYWLDRKFLMGYTHGDEETGPRKAALYAFCYSDGTLHINNVEVLVTVTLYDYGAHFECSLHAGLPGYRVYYDGIAKITLTPTNAMQSFYV